MKVVEIEKQNPIGYYNLTLACSECGQQLTAGFFKPGVFNIHDDKVIEFFYNSNYCMNCGHKWKHNRKLVGFDLRKLFGLTKDECTDDALVTALKKFQYLPEDFYNNPDFKHIVVNTGEWTREVDIWFVDSSRLDPKRRDIMSIS